MEKIIFTRKRFYDLIWSEPLSKLSKKYAISDNGLRKMCTKYNVPIPKNGYWIKLKFNKPVKPEKLPPFKMEEDQIEIFIRDEGSTVNLDASPETLLVREIKADPKAPVTVPEELAKPHFLIKETKRHWADVKKHKNDYNYDKSIPHLSIHVQNEHRSRALRFFDTLLKLLEHRGHKVITRGHETLAVIGEVETKISLREASNRVYRTERNWTTSDLVPNGKLIFKAGKYSWDKEWRDNKTLLESMLAKIVARLEMDAQKEAEWRERSRLAEVQRAEEECIRREKEAIRKAEKFDLLLKQAERFDKAQKIRALIAAARAKALDDGQISQKRKEWIEWASRKADWYDPLCNIKDDILDTEI
jgi:hypothetical protein